MRKDKNFGGNMTIRSIIFYNQDGWLPDEHALYMNTFCMREP